MTPTAAEQPPAVVAAPPAAVVRRRARRRPSRADAQPIARAGRVAGDASRRSPPGPARHPRPSAGPPERGPTLELTGCRRSRQRTTRRVASTRPRSSRSTGPAGPRPTSLRTAAADAPGRADDRRPDDPAAVSLIPFLVVSFGAAAAALIVRRYRRLSLVIGLLGLRRGDHRRPGHRPRRPARSRAGPARDDRVRPPLPGAWLLDRADHRRRRSGDGLAAQPAVGPARWIRSPRAGPVDRRLDHRPRRHPGRRARRLARHARPDRSPPATSRSPVASSGRSPSPARMALVGMAWIARPLGALAEEPTVFGLAYLAGRAGRGHPVRRDPVPSLGGATVRLRPGDRPAAAAGLGAGRLRGRRAGLDGPVDRPAPPAARRRARGRPGDRRPEHHPRGGRRLAPGRPGARRRLLDRPGRRVRHARTGDPRSVGLAADPDLDPRLRRRQDRVRRLGGRGPDAVRDAVGSPTSAAGHAGRPGWPSRSRSSSWRRSGCPGSWSAGTSGPGSSSSASATTDAPAGHARRAGLARRTTGGSRWPARRAPSVARDGRPVRAAAATRCAAREDAGPATIEVRARAGWDANRAPIASVGVLVLALTAHGRRARRARGVDRRGRAGARTDRADGDVRARPDRAAIGRAPRRASSRRPSRARSRRPGRRRTEQPSRPSRSPSRARSRAPRRRPSRPRADANRRDAEPDAKRRSDRAHSRVGSVIRRTIECSRAADTRVAFTGERVAQPEGPAGRPVNAWPWGRLRPVWSPGARGCQRRAVRPAPPRSVLRGERPAVDVALVVDELARARTRAPARSSAVSGPSEAWIRFCAVSSAKSPRIVPGAASFGRVAPTIVADDRDRVRALDGERDERARGDEVDERAEERALAVDRVVALGELAADLDELEPDELQAALLEAGRGSGRRAGAGRRRA